MVVYICNLDNGNAETRDLLPASQPNLISKLQVLEVDSKKSQGI